MSWHKIFGLIVLIALFGVLLRPGATDGIAEANGAQAPALATAPAVGVPVVVKSGGAALYDSPNGAQIRQLETGTIAQALSRTPTGDWIVVEVEAGVQGWLASNKLVSVNPAALPVYGRPQAEQSTQPAQATAAPVEEDSPTPEPTATATATTSPTVKPTATATATAIPPTATPLRTATSQPTATPAVVAQQSIAAPPIEAVQPAKESQPAQASASNPLLRIVGVIRSGGAALADGPSGTSAIVLPAGEIVTLLQRSQDDGWLEVRRGDGSSGWVSQLELLTAGISKLPRVGEAMAARAASASETVAIVAAPVTDSASVRATVRTDGSRLNVRSGPGADFPVVAKADNANSYPALATDAGKGWVQIEIADAPDGTGWVSARFVVLDGEPGE